MTARSNALKQMAFSHFANVLLKSADYTTNLERINKNEHRQSIRRDQSKPS